MSLTIATLVLASSLVLQPAKAAPALTMSDELGAPFSFYLVPSDELGLKDCPQGTQVTYDGAYNTGFGEFRLQFGGMSVVPRVRTLLNGHLPVLEYGANVNGVRYDVEAFATTYKQDPRENLVNLILVTASNPGSETEEATIGASFGPRGTKARHELPCYPWYRDRFMNVEAYGSAANVATTDRTVSRNGHLVFACSAGAAKANVEGVPGVGYGFSLAPGQSRKVVFRVPFVPVDLARGAEVNKVLAGDYADLRQQTVEFWNGIFAREAQIELPERKVTDAMKANLAYMLIGRDVLEDGRHYMQTVNKFQYHHFYPRDSAYFVRTYDMLGLHDVAEETVEYFLDVDANGAVKGLKQLHPDDWGQSLWAVDAHYRSTGDLAFARRVATGLANHLKLFRERCAGDPLGLWPKAIPYDNELINGHYTGHSLWALLGLRCGADLARAVGDEALAKDYMAEHEAYRTKFMRQLGKMTAQTDGYIPPGVDDPAAGNDWDNASGGVYPFDVLEPNHPWAKRTANLVRETKYREGIMTYGPNAWSFARKQEQGEDPDPGYLHHYDAFNVTETLLAQGEQQKVIEDLYGVLTHTASTHAGFEFAIKPWGDRDPQSNYPPHGWFAARYNAFVRNMLVREQGDVLHLASALSPQWVRPGDQVRAKNVSTFFGDVSMTIRSRADGADVTIAPKWRTAPSKMVFHMPWFVEATRVVAGGRELKVVDGAVEMRPSDATLSIDWHWTQKPDLSYDRAVHLWLEKTYNPKPDTDRGFLFPHPSKPIVLGRQRLFVNGYDLKLAAPDGIGDVHYTLDGSTPTIKSSRYDGLVHLTKTATVKAITVMPDGRESAVLVMKLEKVTPRQPKPMTSRASGLDAVVAKGKFEALPDFSKLKAEKRIVVRSFDLNAVKPGDENYAVRFTGYVAIPREGVYTFYAGSDDGSRLWVDGKLLADGNHLQAYTERQGDIALKPGVYPICVEYFQQAEAAYLTVRWEGPGIPKQAIPETALFRPAVTGR